MSRFMAIAITLVAALPDIALAQPPDPPRIEWGAQASTQTGEDGDNTWSPRLTLNLTPLTAIEGSADFRQPKASPYGTPTTGQAYTLHWRQALFTSGRWQVFGVLGVGGTQRVYELPDQIVEGRVGPQVIPAHPFVESGLAVQIGPAVLVEVARWLALRGDLRLTLSDHGGLRGMVGAVVPVGRFRAGDRPGLSKSTPPLAAWQDVKPGREVWITTTSGALMHGEVSEVSTSNLGLRQRSSEVAVALDDIRLVEGRDSLKNGIVIGGAAVGGLLGAMVDGLIPGRQTLFAGSTTVVTPVITPTKKAIDVAIRWH